MKNQSDHKESYMKRSKLFIMQQAIARILEESKNVKLNYALLKNKKKIDKEIDLWKETVKPEGTFKEYIDALNKLKREMSAKLDNGAPKVDQYGECIISAENKEKFEADAKVLKEKYAKEIKENEDKMEEYRIFVNEEEWECKIDFYKIKVSEVPDIVLGAYMEILFDLFEE